jgi:hypothetical protein
MTKNMATNQEIIDRGRVWAAKTLEQIDAFNRLHAAAEAHEKRQLIEYEREVKEHADYCWNLINSDIPLIMARAFQQDLSKVAMQNEFIQLVRRKNQNGIEVSADTMNGTLYIICDRMGLDVFADAELGKLVDQYIDYNDKHGFIVRWYDFPKLLELAMINHKRTQP